MNGDLPRKLLVNAWILRAGAFLAAGIVMIGLVCTGQDHLWSRSGPISPSISTTPGMEAVNGKLNSIIIPKLDFREATLADVVKTLNQSSIDLDAKESDAARRGVKISFKEGSSPSGMLTLSLSNIPLGEALRYVAQLENLQMQVSSSGVALVPKGGA